MKDITLVENGVTVCELSYIRDSGNRVVVMELNTPEQYRGKGYARQLLSELQSVEEQSMRVVSTDHAVGYYRKLGYLEVAPYVFEYNATF
mgnify:CR=1 FL=1